MKHLLWCFWFGLVVSLTVACVESSAVLRLRFENDQARETVRKLEMWVFRTKQVDCRALEDNRVDPNQPGLFKMAHLLITYPPNQSSPQLPKIPTGLMTFYVEGRTESDQSVIQGCSEDEITSTGKVVIKIELGWVCYPESEICFNDKDDDCDGYVDEGCHDCESDSDTRGFYSGHHSKEPRSVQRKVVLQLSHRIEFREPRFWCKAIEFPRYLICGFPAVDQWLRYRNIPSFRKPDLWGCPCFQ